MRRRIGMSRRDLIRRGAIVGGTLIWTIPVVKTIAGAHSTTTGSPSFTCCECRAPQGSNPAGSLRCSGGGNTQECTTAATKTNGSTTYRTDLLSGCQAYCTSVGKAYCYHRSATPLACSGGACGNEHT
jgi:hypothetical protein